MYIFVRLFQGRIIFFLETKRSAQSNALYWQFYVVPITCFGTCCGTWEKLYLDTSPGIGNVHYKKLPCPQIQKKKKKVWLVPQINPVFQYFLSSRAKSDKPQ